MSVYFSEHQGGEKLPEVYESSPSDEEEVYVDLRASFSNDSAAASIFLQERSPLALAQRMLFFRPQATVYVWREGHEIPEVFTRDDLDAR